ncbi:MAG: hypothetical protein KDE20_18865 [Caldilineaceae bacterium]|nr:hypothetical protein [Caldilineaceae bacterium]MCB0156742.1 hypothetical protein [Caldilineaceae bacterium]MCB9161646.1 hypothetical protein [Caldilineaceae bacterium]
MNPRKAFSPTDNPARLGTLITGLVSAVIALLVAFGVQVTQQQQTAILGLVGALIALGVALGAGEWIRNRVTSMANPHTSDGQEAVIVPRASLPTRQWVERDDDGA